MALVRGLIKCDCGTMMESDYTYAGMGYMTCPKCKSGIPLELSPMGIDCALLRKTNTDGTFAKFVPIRAIPNRIYA